MSPGVDAEVAELARKAAAYDVEAARRLVHVVERALGLKKGLFLTERAADEVSRRLDAHAGGDYGCATCRPRLLKLGGNWRLEFDYEKPRDRHVSAVSGERSFDVVVAQDLAEFGSLELDWSHEEGWREVR